MTNLEKFKEVFGIPQDTVLKMSEGICNIISCKSCPIRNAGIDSAEGWDQEYDEK